MRCLQRKTNQTLHGKRAGRPSGHRATDPRNRLPVRLILLLALASSAASQSPPQPAPPILPTIRVDVDLVQLPVAVTDSNGRPYTGLKAENFRLLDNGREQRISHFSIEDVPFSMGLVLDRSGSMAAVIKDVYQAAFHSIRASKAEDEFFIAAFNHQYGLVQDFSTDRALLERQLRVPVAGGQTALYDAVLRALKHVGNGRFEKKALLVVTDGADNSSRIPFEELLTYVRRQEKVTLYTVGLFEMAYLSLFGGPSPEEQQAMNQLSELAEASGGKAFFPRTMEECKQVCVDIAKELRQQYSLGYYPEPRIRDGAWHTVEVQLQSPPGARAGQLAARARAGYFARRD